MILSVVVPTIPGRESELARSIAAYERLTPVGIEWIIERGHSTCAAGWNAGAVKASGEILHMSADDIEPETDEWFWAAIEALREGSVPVGWVREQNTVFGRDFCRLVICRREWWRDVPELHYYSDNAFTDLMIATGHEPVIAPGFDFYHRKSMVGRDDSPERTEREREAYLCSRSPSTSRSATG